MKAMANGVLFKIIFLICAVFVIFYNNSLADDYMQLIATISIERDSTSITEMTPIGDFNADGYPDLAVGLVENVPDPYEAVWLYYGGPDFDVEPDLIILGERQNETDLCESYMPTYFGRRIAGLEDFNGDGYDDIAISAYYYCTDLIEEGRLYIYFGSPEPDTIVDVIIDGEEPYEELGKRLGSGDFNGDGLGDLLATSPMETSLDSRVFIHLGSSTPNNIYDWFYNFVNLNVYLSWYMAGFDLNDDGFDDFCIRVDDSGPFLANVLFLGNDPLNQEPYFSFEQAFHPVEDISGDGIDDFLTIESELRWYLCLGGEPIDFEPDYYIGTQSISVPLCNYDLGYEGVKFIMNDFMSDRFILFNTGIPFDSIPYNVIEHGRPHNYLNQAKIGDINDDGSEDLALVITDDTFMETIEIYSIISTEIDESSDHLPKAPLILCAYPNPFNSDITIVYSASNLGPQPPQIKLQIFDIQGRVVKTLADERKPMGTYRAVWDGTDNQGWPVSSGVYMAKLFQWGQDAGDFPVKITLVK